MHGNVELWADGRLRARSGLAVQLERRMHVVVLCRRCLLRDGMRRSVRRLQSVARRDGGRHVHDGAGRVSADDRLRRVPV
jgi:hypothetical protein